MIVYVESNFFLEVALGQEQATSAGAILALAQQGTIEIAFPAFSLSEPFSTISYRHGQRLLLSVPFEKMLEELKRSQPHRQIASDLQHIPSLLADIVKKERDLLQPTIDQLLTIGRSIETSASIFKQALMYQSQFNLSPQDSIVYAAVVADIHQRPLQETKCFISRDKKAFSIDPDIKTELGLYNCRYIGSFVESLKFIQRFA